MATPTFITGFEHGVVSAQGGGIATAVSGVPTIEVGTAHSGNRCLKIVAVGAGAVNFRRNTSGSAVQIAVLRVYFRIPTGGTPSATASMAGWQITTAAVTVGMTITSAGQMRAVVGSGSAVTGPSVVLDTWHLVELRANITGTTWTLDWTVDGVEQTQAVWAGQSTTDALQYLRLGSASSTLNATICFDDVVMSETSADYPLGGGSTKLLSPIAANAANVGTNIIEEADGTDANSSSYQALNSVPMGDATNYIRQFANGNSNYLELSLENFTEPHSSILGAMALLAYTSATTTSNRGGAIVSKDNFSSYSVLWGEAAATADYSDGSTASAYWKSVIVAGANDNTTIDALAMRLGYSDDASPNPYWLDVGVEVAYVPSNDINLDLVTYSSTVPDVVVLENIVVTLDLVVFTSTIQPITVLENIPVPLDLVSYSSVVNNLTLLENDVVPLDLVSYSSTVQPLVILENVVVALDLVSYTSTVQPLTILENDVVPLDLVTYSSTFNELTILENVVVPLDLVTFSSTVRDVEVLEEGVISLDLVTFTSTIHNLTVLESEIVPLDLVTYSSVFHNVELVEVGGDLLLDLVSYSSVFPNAFLIAVGANVVVPVERILVVDFQDRVYSIARQNRRLSVDGQDRTF